VFPTRAGADRGSVWQGLFSGALEFPFLGELRGRSSQLASLAAEASTLASNALTVGHGRARGLLEQVEDESKYDERARAEDENHDQGKDKLLWTLGVRDDADIELSPELLCVVEHGAALDYQKPGNLHARGPGVA
jgi:hypothetical protein